MKKIGLLALALTLTGVLGACKSADAPDVTPSTAPSPAVSDNAGIQGKERGLGDMVDDTVRGVGDAVGDVARGAGDMARGVGDAMTDMMDGVPDGTYGAYTNRNARQDARYW